MKKLINQHNKDLIITMIIVFVGVYGCMLDYYNGEQDIFPRISIFSFLDEKIPKNEPYKPATYTIYKRYISINSIWFLFVIFGMMLFYVELFKIKSPILIYGIPTILFYRIKLKLLDGKIELYEYLIK